MSIIGNHFDETEYFIAGVVLSIRHYNNKISIWTICSDKDTIMKIGKLFKQTCDLGPNDKIHFQFHNKNPKEGHNPTFTL